MRLALLLILLLTITWFSIKTMCHYTPNTEISQNDQQTQIYLELWL